MKIDVSDEAFSSPAAKHEFQSLEESTIRKKKGENIVQINPRIANFNPNVMLFFIVWGFLYENSALEADRGALELLIYHGELQKKEQRANLIRHFAARLIYNSPNRLERTKQFVDIIAESQKTFLMAWANKYFGLGK